MSKKVSSAGLLLSKVESLTLAHYRYGIDLLSITVSITLSAVFELPLFIREGTVISMLILTYAMNLSLNYHRNRKRPIFE